MIKWHGHIIKLYKYGFEAILRNVTGNCTDYWTQISIDQVSKEDRYLISMGACFWISIHDGFLFRKVIINFMKPSDLPIVEINENFEEIFKDINWK